MEYPLEVTLNGKPRTIEELVSPSPLSAVLERLGLRPDRIAVELNGEIAPRASWPDLPVVENDRIEIVHFVGGGA